MIHKFRDMPTDLNPGKSIYVLIDEAYRKRSREVPDGAGLPNASYIGFTGTPVDKTALARGLSRRPGLPPQVFHRGHLHQANEEEMGIMFNGRDVELQ